VVAEVPLLAQQQAPRCELTEVIGTVIMVIGAGTISIIGVTVDAGSVLQVEDHIRYQVGIAAKLAGRLPRKREERGVGTCYRKGSSPRELGR
jgi:hypothetical protein